MSYWNRGAGGRVINVLVVGCGNVSGIHLENLAVAAGARVVGVADVCEAAARGRAEQFGVERWVVDYRDMVQDPSVDAVFVLTPPASHAEIAIAALRAGKHVFCEKPLAMTSTECAAVVEAASNSGCVFLLGYPMRHSVDALRLKETILSGAIGRPVCYRDVWALSRGSPSPAIHDAAQGGGVLFEHSHWLDFVASIFGNVRRVQAFACRLKRPASATQAVDTFAAILHFESGDVALWSESWAARGGGWDPLGIGRMVRPTLDVIGPQGSLHFPAPDGAQVLSLHAACEHAAPPLAEWSWETDWGVNREAYRLEVEHFLACVRGAASPCCSALDGWRAIRLVEAILESSRTEKAVAVNPRRKSRARKKR
jgi:predicted dehydrogenase